MTLLYALRALWIGIVPRRLVLNVIADECTYFAWSGIFWIAILYWSEVFHNILMWLIRINIYHYCLQPCAVS